MQKTFFCLLMLLFVLPLYAEPEGSLIMLRCDNGNEDGFLKSPADIDLSSLQSNLNPSADTIVLVHGFNTSYSSAKDSFTYARDVLSQELGSSKNYVWLLLAFKHLVELWYCCRPCQ